MHALEWSPPHCQAVLALVSPSPSSFKMQHCELLQIARLLEQGPPSFEQLIDMFGFPLDPVQLDAIKVLLQDESLVISAPTGAGKTAIALAGTVAALSRWA